LFSSTDVDRARPSFASTQAKAYGASMKADLRNLVTAEAADFSDSLTYATSIACSCAGWADALRRWLERDHDEREHRVRHVRDCREPGGRGAGDHRGRARV
jgi:hypothetical protein